jgi:Domain of unknown function (DUF4282)/zinc-ribbon domain
MAFCAKCGTQLAAGAAACSACGAATGTGVPPAAPTPARYIPPIDAQQAAGFITSLFDLSFTSFVIPKIIKVLFVIAIVLAACGALFMLVSGFTAGVTTGIAALVLAPIVFFLYVIGARAYMEVLIVIFRAEEYLKEIAKQGRR